MYRLPPLLLWLIIICHLLCLSLAAGSVCPVPEKKLLFEQAPAIPFQTNAWEPRLPRPGDGDEGEQNLLHWDPFSGCWESVKRTPFDSCCGLWHFFNFLCHVCFSAESVNVKCELPHLACSVYYSTLQDMPAMVRLWWNSQEKRVSAVVEKFTVKYISPVLSAQEISSVQSTDQLSDSMAVSCSSIQFIIYCKPAFCDAFSCLLAVVNLHSVPKIAKWKEEISKCYCCSPATRGFWQCSDCSLAQWKDTFKTYLSGCRKQDSVLWWNKRWSSLHRLFAENYKDHICVLLQVKARSAAREVIATYSVDDIFIELVIQLPQNYPLGSIAVDSGRRVGIALQQWRNWMLQLSTYLTHQVKRQICSRYKRCWK